MSLRKGSSLTARGLALAGVAGLLSITGAVAIGTASADEVTVAGAVSKPISFSCEFPLVGVKTVAATVNITFPDAGKVGEVIQPTDFKVDGKLDAETSDALGLIGATTFEATGAATDVDVKINDTEIGVKLNGLSIPSAPVVPGAETPFVINGPIPGITVKAPGEVSFAVGKKFTATEVTPKDAQGNPTDLGTFPLDCTAADGQDTALATIPVS
ncbi:DUF6801 domain-containing protein [Amycolatopsis nigrescens]|uniref:DUF6801 domain-containing protein n=1 Tax=Amycolatopsis nigrescens TaxID=381445 RepID=UPI000380BF80|nr:DUF6801 domain-containing protein [Amycolatopsis nigrescens]